MSKDSAGHQELIWSHDFGKQQGGLPDSNVWNFEIGDGTANGIPGWGNQELEYYRADNAVVRAGQGLVIRAERNNDLSLAAYYGRPAEWTSARMQTLGKVHFHYGRFEIRAKLPKGDGTWPALWFLGTDIGDVGWPQCGEIDLAETRGDQPDVLFNTLHGPGYSGDHGLGLKKSRDFDLSEDYHIYGLEWLPGFISWSIDGQVTFSATAQDASGEWVFDHPHFMIMNLAIGGNFTGPVDPNLQSAELVVDYIRHYRVDGVGTVWTA